MAETKKRFWETLPGILTGIAAVITAVGGVLALFFGPSSSSKADSAPDVDYAKPAAVSKPANVYTPPAPVAPTVREPNLSGMWVDQDGIQIQVTQNGSQINSTAYDPYSGSPVAWGQGSLTGRTLTGQNRWANGAVYTTRLQVSDDGRSITGTYQSPTTGERGSVYLQRQ